jgi:hypothetical protein
MACYWVGCATLMTSACEHLSRDKFSSWRSCCLIAGELSRTWKLSGDLSWEARKTALGRHSEAYAVNRFGTRPELLIA